MSVAASGGNAHAALMDAVYRHQRLIYNATRRYYLLGRDHMLRGLAVPAGGTVLELGCGTGRNLVCAARHYPNARLHGLDISAAMLETASAAIARSGLAGRIQLAAGDASEFHAEGLFGIASFDRIFISYSLSMIPDWQRTLEASLDALAPGGTLSIVDFGTGERLPAWFTTGLNRWLAAFHVTPRADLPAALQALCERRGATLRLESLFRGYAIHAVVRN